MMTIRRSVAAAALALAIGAGSPTFAGTTTVDFQSDANTTRRKLGSFSGSATYDDVAGLLTVTMNNISAAGNGGAALTGVAINIAGSATAAYVDGDSPATPRSDEDAFDDARRGRARRPIKVKRLGTFDAGAAVNGKWGKASRRAAAMGVSSGSSRTFVFDVDGATPGMTVADFLSGNVGIAASFRGRKADRVGGVIVPTSPSTPGAPVVSGPEETDNGSINPPVIIIDDGGITPPAGGVIIPPDVNIGGNGSGGNGGTTSGAPGDNGGPAAVPLPPAVWSGLAGLVALATPRVRRKLRQML